MKTYNTRYSDYDTLDKYIRENEIYKSENILVQIFSDISNKKLLSEVIKSLREILPQAKILGATSSAGILDGKTVGESLILSITVFEKTKIKSIIIKEDISDYSKGLLLGKKLISPNVKAIISFISSKIDGEEFLDGINSVNSDVIVAGGVAGRSKFKDKEYVFTEKGIESNAVAAVSLEGEELWVNNFSNFNWIPIGKEYIVTDAEGKIIKSIDNIPATDFYKKYIGITNKNKVSRIGARFPLMIKKKGIYLSRTVVRFTEDQGIILTSKINTGEKVRLGYGDMFEIIKSSDSLYESINNSPTESLFIYSSTSRRVFLKKTADVEISPLSNSISTSGFYMKGEFNHINNANMLFTDTMTILTLSESKDKRIKIHSQINQNTSNYACNEKTILYNLIKTTGEELTEINSRLEEKVLEKTKELKTQYYTDSLTGLQNRNKLTKDLCNNKYIKLALIDINYFKGINDFYGNSVGDSVLAELGRIIKIYSYEVSLQCFRLNSDVFAVALEREKFNLDFLEKIEVLHKIIDEQCFYYREFKIFLSSTIGVAINEERLLEKAEMALNYAKRNKKSIQIYNENSDLSKDIEENLTWIKKIKDAIKEDRIVPFFQPIVNNHSGNVEKYEALIRMIDENGKVISPFFFLDKAIKSNLYSQLTKIMLEKTFHAFKNSDYEFSINLLLEDIDNEETRSLIFQKLKETNKPNKVVFEIVESEGIEKFDEVSKFIDKVKKMGAKFAIDDFGTGYSNFSYLMKLNVDYIKIDGSIIKDVRKDRAAEIVAKTIVTFAKEFGIRTIAEFVSEEEIYDKVKSIDIDFSQGYYFSEPKANL